MMLKLFKRDESFGAMLEDVLYFKAEGQIAEKEPHTKKK